MNLFKFSSISFLFFFSFVLATPAFAIETPPVVKTTTAVKPSSNVVVLATVNIQNAKIVSQNGNVFDISFSFSNREALQTGVKYGIELIKESKTGQLIIDEKVYDESLTLNPNTSINKDIVYTAPSSLNGEYSMILSSSNSSGFPFAISSLGNVNLKSSTEGIQILSETCYLQVVREENSPHYTLAQGVDINTDEDLKLTCSVSNSSVFDILATPKYEIHNKSVYGDIIPSFGGDTDVILFKSVSKKEISLILPKQTLPQSYSLDFYFLDNNKSNVVNLYFIVRGINATIQNISLDKDYYNKGDIAKISLVYNSSSGSLGGGRLGEQETYLIFSTFKITNGGGKSCSSPQTKDLSKEESIFVNYSAEISSSCFDPKVLITLTDDKGAVLDQKEFNISTTSVPNNNSNILSYIIICILLLLIIIFIFYKKTKNKDLNTKNITLGIFLFFMMIIFSLIPAGKIKADTITTGTDYIVVSINKSSYYPGENISLSGYLYYSSGGTILPYNNGSISASVPTTSLSTSVYPSGTASLSAPSYGSYNMRFNVTYTSRICHGGGQGGSVCSDVDHYSTWDIPFVVPAPPTPTVTVTATNNTSNLKSTSNLIVPFNTSVRISWASENATSCDSGGHGTETTGWFDVPNMTSTKNFTVTCSN